jgi:hypothetical protein
MIAIPLQEERDLELHQRLSLPFPAWRVSRMWTRLAFFVLSCFATSFLFGLLQLMELPKGWITAIATVGFAEYLVLRKKFLRTGIEEGFYIAGLCAFIFGLPGEGKPEAVLLFVLAFLIAGVRLANGLFVAVGGLLIVAYAGWKSELPVTAVVAFTIFVFAALLNARTFARPFASFAMAILTTVLLPLAALLFWENLNPLLIVVPVGLGWIAITRRDRPLLLAALFTSIVVAVHTFKDLPWPWEQKLLSSGVALLVVAMATQRLLRNRGAGITSDRLTDVPQADAIEMAGAVVITPTAAAAKEPELKTGGGSFGGAGATGEF